jgi:hypothetical protein
MRALSLLIFLVIIYTGGCTTKDKAPERSFYYEILNHDHSSNQLADYLKTHIANNKYTITNGSGMQWPFYRELKPNEDIPKDSLMAPHWFLHRMIPKKINQQLKIDEYLVRIDLSPQPDTIPNYSVEIFRMDSSGLVLSASSGVHYLDSIEFSTQATVNKLYLKSIIRYSFK